MLAKPLLNVFCIEEPSCDYPVAIRLPMDDGSVLTYVLENKTDFQFRKVMKSLEKVVVGYEYKPRRKNRIHRGKR